MQRLRELVERRKEVGKRPSHTKGGNYNDLVEYERLGELILEEVNKLYDDGKLK